MRMYYSVNESFLDVVPEIDQHEVRYSAYTLKSSQNPQIVITNKRKYLPYDVKPDVDCEFDYEGDRPDYASYVLPNINSEPIVHQENNTLLPTKKKVKEELSLDNIYSTLHEIKVSTIRKILNESREELTEILNNPPNKKSLSISTQFYKTMFNPDQKFCILMSLREIFNVPVHEFQNFQHLYTLVAPEAAIIIFKKKFKFKTRTLAVKKLVILELLNVSFYSDKAAKDLYCLT
ncbi:uncharacterized protein LOC112680955 [Sipha flava]|uniref:Uncharacterized protein LOC112680955 n=1 Tax=Sipha flava TaxID=143950 RepID=A0A2S2R6W2_9HEMI|nr:uncharacterized protein LOC112680955 [Sipha flava]